MDNFVQFDFRTHRHSFDCLMMPCAEFPAMIFATMLTNNIRLFLFIYTLPCKAGVTDSVLSLIYFVWIFICLFDFCIYRILFFKFVLKTQKCQFWLNFWITVNSQLWRHYIYAMAGIKIHNLNFIKILRFSFRILVNFIKECLPNFGKFSQSFKKIFSCDFSVMRHTNKQILGFISVIYYMRLYWKLPSLPVMFRIGGGTE